jgi:hypothetical protein
MLTSWLSFRGLGNGLSAPDQGSVVADKIPYVSAIAWKELTQSSGPFAEKKLS